MCGCVRQGPPSSSPPGCVAAPPQAAMHWARGDSGLRRGPGLSRSVMEHMADRVVRGAASTDPNEAQSFVADSITEQAVLPSGTTISRWKLRALRVGSMTAGHLGFGRPTSVSTAQSTNFRVCIPLRGGAVTRSGRSPAIETTPGEAAVIPPEAPAQAIWSPDCQQLVLMVPREVVELELVTLLGRSLPAPSRFTLHMLKSGPARSLWRSPLDMLSREILAPSGLFSHAGRTSRAGPHPRWALAGPPSQLQRDRRPSRRTGPTHGDRPRRGNCCQSPARTPVDGCTGLAG